MSDLNEYVAEAVEIAYGVEYDTDKAARFIAKLEEWRWRIIDVSDEVCDVLP
jgi:hypothetical protein